MSKRIPSIDVFRSVKNITEEDISYMQRDADSRNGGLKREKTQTLFEKGVVLPLRAALVRRAELMNLQQEIGRCNEVDQEHIEQLADRISDVLSGFSEKPRQVSTLPSGIHKLDKHAVLTVGSNIQLCQERFLAKQAVHTFYDLEEEPEGVWRDDHFMASIHVMRGRNAHERRVIDRLNDALLIGARLLPEQIELGPVEIQLSR